MGRDGLESSCPTDDNDRPSILNEYYQHRYNTMKTVKSRTASTEQKGSKSTYDCSVLLRQLRSIRHSVPATTILSSRWYCRGGTTEMPSWPVFLPTWSGVFSRLTVRRRKHGRKVGVDLRWMGWIAFPFLVCPFPVCRYCSTHASPIPFPPLFSSSPFNAAEMSAEAL